MASYPKLCLNCLCASLYLSAFVYLVFCLFNYGSERSWFGNSGRVLVRCHDHQSARCCRNARSPTRYGMARLISASPLGTNRICRTVIVQLHLIWLSEDPSAVINYATVACLASSS